MSSKSPDSLMFSMSPASLMSSKAPASLMSSTSLDHLMFSNYYLMSGQQPEVYQMMWQPDLIQRSLYQHSQYAQYYR